jgi:hypothetical protein
MVRLVELKVITTLMASRLATNTPIMEIEEESNPTN